VNRAKSKKTAALLAATAALAMVSAGCTVTTDNSHSAERESRTVELKGARSVQVNVEMGAGELKIRGGAAPLMDADFRYSRAEWKPELKYEVTGERGTLVVRQHGNHSIGSNNKNEWELRLNEDVPMDLTVNLGAGQGILDLGNVSLHSLDVEMGVGELKLNLTGHPRNNVDVRVNGGVGEATVRLPRRARLEVEAHGGIGEITTSGLTKRDSLWVNEPSGETDVTMHVSVNGGIGGMHLICE
jgi:N-terminal domain of toast_rack, DUF2154